MSKYSKQIKHLEKMLKIVNALRDSINTNQKMDLNSFEYQSLESLYLRITDPIIAELKRFQDKKS